MAGRNTIQRSLTLRAVRALRSHPTAEEVYRAVAAENPSISRATVYRNLKQLSDSGLLLQIKTAGGADHFDHRCDAHCHAGCLHCGRVFDIELTHPLNPLESLADTHGFAVSGYEFLFTGVCADCRSALEHEK